MNYRVLNAGRPRHSRAMISAARRLRAQGNTYREIGEVLGLTKDQVIGIAHRHFVPHCRGSADQHRAAFKVVA